MPSLFRKTLLTLSLATIFAGTALSASAATDEGSSTSSYSEAARDMGISEKEFQNEIQQAADKSENKPNTKVNPERVHFEFRTTNAYDSTYRITKETKSAYHLKSNTVNRPWYSAEAWGHSYLAGHTGNISVSGKGTDTKKNIYEIHKNTKYKLTNYLVERYGTGNNAYIMAWSYGNGNAWGYWNPDHAMQI